MLMTRTILQSFPTTRERFSVPGPGRTVSAAAEARAVHIRKAVDALETYLIDYEGVGSRFSSLFAPRCEGLNLIGAGEPFSKRAAWALVNMWLLGRNAGAISQTGTIVEAEDWFLGTEREELSSLARALPQAIVRLAASFLLNVAFDENFLDLLPYLLDAHGPGTRLSVLKNPETQPARVAKRQNGVFYTPADVAEYMAECVLSKYRESFLTYKCLDPACGTGVFLVALMQKYSESEEGERADRFSFATQSLYGFDLSPLAVETCGFVLLHHCLSEVLSRKINPWSAWHALRLNLAAVDAITVFREEGERQSLHGELAMKRASVRAALLSRDGFAAPHLQKRLRKDEGSAETQCWMTSRTTGNSLRAIFPEAEQGFEILAGNPPYALLGERSDHDYLGTEYVSMKNGSRSETANIYPLFIEMMWRLTKPANNVSALVVPLSISYHQGQQYSECRKAMAYQGGCWSFSFFDREPHGLFGDDVKTRNAIVIHRETVLDSLRGVLARFETGHLRKWTSRTRDRLFSSISFTPLDVAKLSRGIPKLSGVEQAEAFAQLYRRCDSLGTLWSRARTCLPTEACDTRRTPRVYVASTAYNFLNVFRYIKLDSSIPYPLSENTILCLEFSSEQLAEVAFSILSSRLTFWLWHTLCDGFHVSRWFIESIPFGRDSLTKEQIKALSVCGGKLWAGLQGHRIVSVNGGKQTIAYKPLCLESERNVIDSVLIDAAHLQDSFGKVLQDFVRNNVVVDESDNRRKHLRSPFQ